MIGEADRALARLRDWAYQLPGTADDLRPDPIKDLMIVIDATVANHTHPDHRHLYPHGVTGPNIVMVPGSHEEAPEAAPRPQAPDSPSAASEYRRRPGKDTPSERRALMQAQEALVEAGIPGYGPLSVHYGVRALARMLDRFRDELATAQASTRQHLEASSHRAQIAEHYRAALQRIADDPNTDWREYARSALQAPEWDKRIRP